MDSEATACAQAIALAELANNECWESLAELERQTPASEQAHPAEPDPVRLVRAWLTSAKAGPAAESRNRRH